MKIISVVVFLFAFFNAASSCVLGADVRNSRWGDSPETVKRNQEEVSEEQISDPRVTKLLGAAVIDGLSFNITYTFFDKALVEVSLSASFNRAIQAQGNRPANWNPFNDARTLTVLLRTKYGPEVDEEFSLNYEKMGSLDALRWADRMPSVAFQELAWGTSTTNIQLFANTTINSNVDYRVCSVTYKDKGRRSADYDTYEKAITERETTQKRANATKGL
jgi:hypothetical protein